jgi:hypothetical protein
MSSATQSRGYNGRFHREYVTLHAKRCVDNLPRFSSQHAAVPNLQYDIVSALVTRPSFLLPPFFPFRTLMFVLEALNLKKDNDLRHILRISNPNQ